MAFSFFSSSSPNSFKFSKSNPKNNSTTSIGSSIPGQPGPFSSNPSQSGSPVTAPTPNLTGSSSSTTTVMQAEEPKSGPSSGPGREKSLFGPFLGFMCTGRSGEFFLDVIMYVVICLFTTWLFPKNTLTQYIFFALRIMSSLSSAVTKSIEDHYSKKKKKSVTVVESESKSRPEALDSVGCCSKEKTTYEDVNETSENSSCASEVSGNSPSHPSSAKLTSLESPPSSEFEQLMLCLEETLPEQHLRIIKEIQGKHGDITERSILKSVEAKTNFYKTVAEVVELLDNNKLDTNDANEMQKIQNWIDNAEADGFCVEWLQERVERVVFVSKYQQSVERFKEIGEEIKAVKAALVEMEVQQMDLKEDMNLMEAEMGGYVVVRSGM